MKSSIHKPVVWTKSKLELIKRVVAGGSLLILLPAAQAQYTWPVYEPFGQFTNDTRLGANNTTMATNFWNIGNSTGTSNPRVFDYAALSYPALVADTNTVPKGVISASNSGSRDAGAHFTSHPGAIYCSFLISNIYNNPSLWSPPTITDRMFFNLADSDSATSFRLSVYLTPDYRLKVRKNPSGNPSGTFSAATPALTTNATHLVVIRYLTNSVSGAPARVDLWLDPTPFGDNANIPPPTITTTNGANVNSFQCMALTSRNTGLYSFSMDEIRLGDTWASVTPATAVAGPVFGVTGGGNGCAGDSFSIGLSGSVTTNDYLFYTNAVYAGVTLPGTGAVLDFGAQTTVGYYSVLASNTVTANVGWMSNSPIVTIKASAVILTNPVPMTVANNNRAEFKVFAAGDFVSYQWFKDGTVTPLTNDSHLTGSTTNDLIIWPATVADAGGYYCRVSDTCGNVLFTTTNTLTLSAPADLVWAGDAFNICVWDIFTTQTEWSGGSGFFNPGDNVTFDDAFILANAITLNGVLTPSQMTVNAARDYTWAGAGTIAGSTALVKSGTGRLNLNGNAGAGFANSYTGGTVISNGIVSITNNWLNLGSGPVTLAGGTLENWVKGNAGGPGVEQGLSNNVIVTANSTWQLDRTGDQAGALLGSLNGNGGITLSFYHSATNLNSTNRFRFGGVFTNSLSIAASANPLATNSPLDIGTYNNIGVQVYNGPISGTNTGFLVAGTGEVYLNGANTYTRDTVISAGFMAGSGSISGQLMVTNGATLGGGSQTAIGTFTVNSNVIVKGNVRIRVDKSLAQSNDLISATGIITNSGTGTITITNIGGTPVAAGDSFKIFSGAVSNGAAITVTDGGITAWTNKLAIDGTVQALSVVPSYSTNISYTVSGNTLTITWPATHLGWILQSQTNNLNVGLKTNNWVNVSGSASVTSVPITINSGNPTVFYRLSH